MRKMKRKFRTFRERRGKKKERTEEGKGDEGKNAS